MQKEAWAGLSGKDKNIRKKGLRESDRSEQGARPSMEAHGDKTRDELLAGGQRSKFRRKEVRGGKRKKKKERWS